MFLLALSGSAFSRYAGSSKDVTPAYYYDAAFARCKTTSITSGQCTIANVGNPCYQFVPEYGNYTYLYQNGIVSTCYQPFYQYP